MLSSPLHYYYFLSTPPRVNFFPILEYHKLCHQINALPARLSLAEPSSRVCDDQRAWAAEKDLGDGPGIDITFATRALCIAIFPAGR